MKKIVLFALGLVAGATTYAQDEVGLTLGAVPYATDFYGANGFAVTNISVQAAKEIRVTDSFTLPLFAGIAANPCAQKTYLYFGFTLQP